MKPSPRHHVVDVEQSESVQEADTLPAADSTLAENLRDRLTLAGGERGPHVQDSVVEKNADPTRNGDPPTPSIPVIRSPDAREGNTIRSYPIISESHSHRVGLPEGILESCSWCKKMLPENSNLHMYGYNLGVYCSIECRKKQMALDGYDIDDHVPRKQL